MNLRVDLILESEQRSGSIINLKSIMRVASIVIPGIIIATICFAGLNSMKLKNKLKNLEQEMEVQGPRQQASIKLRNQLNRNISILEELEGWEAAHMNWRDVLLDIQKEIPDQIQLTALSIDQVLQHVKKVPARVFKLTLKGKAKGAFSEDNIIKLSDSLKTAKQFSEIIKKVDVWADIDNSKDADKNDRIFKIDCDLKPRKFE
jgi:hypothetical protein